jgi:serine protease Do
MNDKMNREELAIEIEKYLEGQLSAEEAKKLELLIVADDKIAKEVELHKNLHLAIKSVYERQELKKKFTAWENDKTFPVQTKRKTGLWRPIMAAASISLLITVGGLSIYHFAVDQKTAIKEGPGQLTRNEVSSMISTSIDAATKEESQPVSINRATAFVLTSDGYLVTNYHVVEGKKSVTLQQQGDSLISYKANVIETDKNLDFALLKVADPKFNSFAKVPYNISDKNVVLAQKIYTLGYPKNDIVYSDGAISSLSGYKGDTMFYQLNIISAPGQSGSPIMNEKGELLGILASKNLEAEGQTYCVKMKYILNHIDKIRETNSDLNVKTVYRSKLTGKKLTEQVNTIMPFIFIVKAQ